MSSIRRQARSRCWPTRCAFRQRRPASAGDRRCSGNTPARCCRGLRTGLHGTRAMFAPVETRRASDEIISQIRMQLEAGKLKPGDRLPSERELAETFRVSRNTVREAIRSLEHTGLLRLRKGATGGAFVSDRGGTAIVSAFGDLFALGVFRPEHLAAARTIVGTSAARLACARASAADMAALQACVESAVAAGRAGDLATRSAANFEFHRLLALASGNPILVILTEAISEINRRFADQAG